MITGLWWYDDNPTHSLAQKVAIAAARHAQKFGTVPDTCYVHPTMVDSEVEIGTVAVKPLRTVSQNYFWIGQEKGEENVIQHQQLDNQAA